MTPEEAAICLRDDPTFAMSSPEEQAEEAALLLGSDDPLDIALAVELALTAGHAVATPKGGVGDEGCRLETPCAAPRLAGNGRCLDCGASRVLAPVPLTAKEAIAPGPRKPKPPSELRRGVTHDPAASFLGRFKEATGATDNEMADMLGVSRATVQAYIAGRRREIIENDTARKMIDGLADRLLLLADLKRDIAAAIGEVD